MKSILEHIKEIPRVDWDYYYEIDGSEKLKNPFHGNNDHIFFIKEYFKRGGKIKVIDEINIDINTLRYPNHINAVFFLGLIVYYNTDICKKYKLGRNAPGYKTFPFVWYLTTLFHDYAYQIEKDSDLLEKNKTLKDLYSNFEIENDLLETNLVEVPKDLINSCKEYFNYRINEFQVIDHGIFAGLILFDRLVKIRIEKVKQKEDALFWNKSLEKQYKLAASAIATHNMWFPESDKIEVYKEYKLGQLSKMPPLKFKDFKLLYILGIVDTIDPIKVFSNDFEDTYILNNLELSFTKFSLLISNKPNSKLNFKMLVKQAVGLHGWLDVKVTFYNNSLKIDFR